MRHRLRSQRLSRPMGQRDALLRSLVSGLLRQGRITTTPAKAKAARRLAERLVTLAKSNTIASRRRADAVLQSKPLTRRLFRDIGPLFRERRGGYTRIVRLPRWRRGDGAELAVLEWTAQPEPPAAPAQRRAAATAGTKDKQAPRTEPSAPQPEAEDVAPKPSTRRAGRKGEPKSRKFGEGLRKFFRRKQER